MDAGESAAEACAGEALEETGLVVEAGRLFGVYTTPDRIIEYANGNRHQSVSLNFVAVPVGGELGLSDETTDVGYFSAEEIKAMDVWEHHRLRTDDAFAGLNEAFVR